MRRTVAAVAYAVAALAVLLLLVLPGNQYDWMREMDPTVAPGDIEDQGGNAQVVAGLLLMIGVGVALVAMRTARSGWARGLAVAVGVVGAATWAWRFGR